MVQTHSFQHAFAWNRNELPKSNQVVAASLTILHKHLGAMFMRFVIILSCRTRHWSALKVQ